MLKKLIFINLMLLIFSSLAHAGSFYSNYNESSSVVTSIEIEGKGIFNLVVSAQFLKEPRDQSPFTSDHYEELINRLNVEWKNIAINTMLKSHIYKLSELSSLKDQINIELVKLIKHLKSKYKIKDDVEVVYSIIGFYLVNLNDE